MTNRDTFFVFSGMGTVWSTQDQLHFYVHLVMGRECSTQVEVYFCPRWHGSGMVNMCLDKFCFLADKLSCILCSLHGGECLTKVEIPFVPSLAYEGFCQQ